MTRGNQRELARKKQVKKQQEQAKAVKTGDRAANKGTTLETRKMRDADIMREKQKKASDKGASK